VRRSHLGLLIGLGAIVAVAAIVGVLTTRGAAHAATATNPTPAWLQTKTSQIVGSHPGSTAQSAVWVLTTVGCYHDVVPDQGAADAATADKPVYVVVVDGTFTAPHIIEAGAAVTGTQLILEFNPDTHDLAVLGILKTPINPSELGTVEKMSQ